MSEVDINYNNKWKSPQGKTNNVIGSNRFSSVVNKNKGSHSQLLNNSVVRFLYLALKFTTTYTYNLTMFDRYKMDKTTNVTESI